MLCVLLTALTEEEKKEEKFLSRKLDNVCDDIIIMICLSGYCFFFCVLYPQSLRQEIVPTVV